ncbi:hypothetical protein D3C84_1010500 [compost metagenome]
MRPLPPVIFTHQVATDFIELIGERTDRRTPTAAFIAADVEPQPNGCIHGLEFGNFWLAG